MRSALASLLAGALLVGASGGARAQEEVVAAQPAAPPQLHFWQGEPPPDSVEHRLDERTALTLGRNKLKLGILAFGYGIFDWLNVGSDPPYWVLRSVSSVLVPNGHVKIVPLRRSGLWVAGNFAFYYAGVSKDDRASGKLFVVPMSLFVSVKPLPKFWVHGEGAYIFANLDGTGDYKRITLGGTAAAQAAQVGLMLQYELTRVVSLTLWGRYQPYTSRISLDGSGPVGDGGTATVQGVIEPQLLHPWAVVPGVALMWKYVRLVVGAGYGSYFLPGMDIPVRGAGFVPDASLYVVL